MRLKENAEFVFANKIVFWPLLSPTLLHVSNIFAEYKQLYKLSLVTTLAIWLGFLTGFGVSK